MQNLVQHFLQNGLSRRGFRHRLSALGLTLAAAESFVEPLDASEDAGRGLAVPGSTMLRGTGGELVMVQALAAGAEYVFTNPGSFEVGFFDAQLSSGIPLIMGLHEGIVIALADGYHRVSPKPAFVNIHVIVGTAQATGQLYNASRDGSYPLARPSPSRHRRGRRSSQPAESEYLRSPPETWGKTSTRASPLDPLRTADRRLSEALLRT